MKRRSVVGFDPRGTRRGTKSGRTAPTPLQPRSIRAQPTWRTLTTSLGSLPAGQWGPPERAPGANAGKQRAFNTLAKDPSEVAGRPHRATRTASELSAKGADESPLKPSGATRHGCGCCSPSPDRAGGLASTVSALGRGRATATVSPFRKGADGDGTTESRQRRRSSAV